MLIQKEELLDRIPEASGKEFIALSDHLSALNKVLGETEDDVSDPLIDQWEADIAAGRIPDLDEV